MVTSSATVLHRYDSTIDRGCTLCLLSCFSSSRGGVLASGAVSIEVRVLAMFAIAGREHTAAVIARRDPE
jgi:hypothetical protein